MRFLIKGCFIIALLALSTSVQLQLGDLFAPFDCREHAEFFYDEPVVETVVDSSLLVVQEPEPQIVIDTVDGWRNWHYVENYAFGKDRGAIPMITELDALHPYFRDQ